MSWVRADFYELGEPKVQISDYSKDTNKPNSNLECQILYNKMLFFLGIKAILIYEFKLR